MSNSLKRYTDEELAAELAYWVQERDGVTAWGASLAAALEFIKELQTETKLREAHAKQLPQGYIS